MSILRTLILLFASIVVAACATTNSNAMETAETSAASYCSEMPFAGLSACVLNRFNMAYPRWHSDANADLVNIFLAWADAAGHRVAEGTLNEQDAKQKAYELQGRLDQIAYNRRIRREINSQVAAQLMLTGAAFVAAAGQQAPMAPVVTPMGQPKLTPAQDRISPVPISSLPSLRTTSVASPLIVCSVTGDAQFAVAACH